jgi:hypothetical protein
MKSSKIFAVAIALIAWFALGLQQYILIDNTPGNGLTVAGAVGRFFLFFTVLSNLLVAISLTATVLMPGSRMGRFFSGASPKAAIAVYIFIVGLVYNLVLRQTWQPEGWQRVADELLHVAVPVLYIIYWLFIVPKGKLDWKDSLPWLFFPAIYVVYALARGIVEGFYAYPFLDIKVHGAGKVALNCAGLFVVFLVTGLLVIAVDKKMRTVKNS